MAACFCWRQATRRLPTVLMLGETRCTQTSLSSLQAPAPLMPNTKLIIHIHHVSHAETSCQAGYGVVDGVCMQCTNGQTSPGGEDEPECEDCPAGQVPKADLSGCDAVPGA